MPRQLSSENFQLELLSSPSQQHLNPSRSSSVTSTASHSNDDHEEHLTEMDRATGPSGPGNNGQASTLKSHKLDLYSIPVFLLEILLLIGLAFTAYYVHFQYQHEPLISGFYCDDVSYRQSFVETQLTQFFTKRDTELTVLLLLLALPISVIIFIELVNSMFGSLKFRQIRALCTCCKLHSITRRTFRFAGAYALGFLLVMISCDILANSTGRLRPYFAQECPAAYQTCFLQKSSQSQARDLSIPPTQLPASLTTPTTITTTAATTLAPANKRDSSPSVEPALQPVIIEAATNHSAPLALILAEPQVMSSSSLAPPTSPQVVPSGTINLPETSKIKQSISSLQVLLERRWNDLSAQNLKEICPQDSTDNYTIASMAMSWPSFPAAVFTYSCLFIACYLSFVGTARPFRLITCVLVAILLLTATIFSVSLVKDHYNHWDDVLAGSALSLTVVIFVLVVYLNRFRDSHYYENQKLIARVAGANVSSNRSFYVNSDMGHVNDAAEHQFKSGPNASVNGMTIENGDTGVSNNDLAMRYFQIPRANYRGAPRPLSSLNQMR